MCGRLLLHEQSKSANRPHEWELQHGAGSSGQAGLQTMTLPLLSSFLKPTPKKPKGKDKLNDPEGGPKKKLPKLTPGGQPEGQPPGSQLGSFKYINNNKWLVASGRVWFLDAIAKHLGVTQKGPCWSFLLSFCQDINRPARCPHWGEKFHENATSAAHLLKLAPGKTFDLQAIANDPHLSREATAQEKAGVVNTAFTSTNQHQRGRGKGKGRGRGDGRGKGRGRGGGDFIDTDAVNEANTGDDEEPNFRRPPED